MNFSGRQRALHETIGVQKTGGTDASAYWDFRPQQRVMTVDGILGTVEAVLDGPWPGAEEYQVVLDDGMGGGSYVSSQLTAAAQTTASEHHLASDDYPEMGAVLFERPDPAKVQRHASLQAEAMDGRYKNWLEDHGWQRDDGKTKRYTLAEPGIEASHHVTQSGMRRWKHQVTDWQSGRTADVGTPDPNLTHPDKAAYHHSPFAARSVLDKIRNDFYGGDDHPHTFSRGQSRFEPIVPGAHVDEGAY